MNNLYVYAPEGTIVLGPMRLPTAWSNTSGFNLLSIAMLNARGWYEYSEEAVSHDFYELGTPSDTISNGVFSRTFPNKTLKPDEDLRAFRYNELGALRYDKETAGVVVGADTVPTDEGSQAKISGALAKGGRSPSHTFDFKVGPGQFRQFSKAEVEAIFDAVSDHVQACYTAEKVHAEAISFLSGQAIVDYDITTGWPG